MNVLGSPREIGAELRGARCRARLTQAEVGRVVGYSASAISRIEGGTLRLDHERLMRLAAVLRIPPDRLSATPAPVGTALDTVKRPADDAEDAVHRRNLLTGALAVGASAVVGAPPSRATASEPTEPAGIEDILFRLPTAESAPPTRLLQQAASAREDFRAARYSDLARVLPGLIATASATREATGGRDREVAGTVLARAYVLASELALKQHSDAAWVAADRALTAARATGHPVPIGEASRVLAITMRRSGQCQAAVRLLTDQAADLDATRAAGSAVRASLMLTAAYTAATAQDRTTALGLLTAADDATVDEPSAAGLFTVDATRAQVDVYRVGVLTVLGTPDEAVPIARRIDVAALPTPERRARAWTDTARMWHALGNDEQTYTALRHIEQEAPQEVRRPAVRALTTGVLYGPARVPGLREFAVRTGAVPA
ncbi:helix-turn-helix transcriptional regulator [Streptantibioticus parmotrematis]|uniref:helix-turn-helix domain-containing protein n=1 Tax=Streptantibioticus parmotrematis TaxID=2873249 RepID=UPI003406DC00